MEDFYMTPACVFPPKMKQLVVYEKRVDLWCWRAALERARVAIPADGLCVCSPVESVLAVVLLLLSTRQS
jgi:hypothetical protein